MPPHCVAAAREYVQAALGLQVWAHRLYRQATAEPRPQSEGGRPR